MISATIITLNEQDYIQNAIESVKSLAEEIIVVDSGSKDKTVEIAKKLGAKVFIRAFDNFANQKNFAVSKSTNDWIISLDADEEIPLNLSEEIKKAVMNQEFVAFLIPRRNFILGKEIKHSWWSPDMHIWLWRKDKGKWIGDVHEELEVGGKVGKLKNAKLHFQSKSISEFMEGNELYSLILAKSLFRKGVRFSLLRLFWDPVLEFLIRFVYKLGFLDGLRGFVLAYLMAIYKVTVLIKIYELQNLK